MFDYDSIKKVTLSSNPALNSDFIVMAILSPMGLLAFCRIRDESWTIVWEPFFRFDEKIDVTYHNGRFYSVTTHGKVIVYDVDAPQRIVLPSLLQDGWIRKYLVDQSSRDLLMVLWNFGGQLKHDVFKLDVDGQPKWLQVEDIGNSMLFFSGTNCCFSLSTDNFDRWGGNFIHHTVPYFLQNYEDDDLMSHAMNSLNLKDNRVVQIACKLGVSSIHCSPPMWVTPSLL